MFQLQSYRNRFLWRSDRPRRVSSMKPIQRFRIQKPVCASENNKPVRVDLEDGSILFKFGTSSEPSTKNGAELIPTTESKEVQKHYDLHDDLNHNNHNSSKTVDANWTRKNLTGMRVRDLRQLCRKREIRGVSALRKADLVEKMLLFESNGTNTNTTNAY
eukprot:g5889.t1